MVYVSVSVLSIYVSVSVDVSGNVCMFQCVGFSLRIWVYICVGV